MNANKGDIASEVSEGSLRITQRQYPGNACDIFELKTHGFWSAGAEELAMITKRPEPLK